GVSRESVANYMRILRLPDVVQAFIAKGILGFSEARVLLQVANPEETVFIAKEAIEKKMSVAQLIEYVDNTNLPRQARSAPPRAETDPNVRQAQRNLEEALGCRVRINDRKGRGKIVIDYATLEDFDRVVEMLKGGK
ncbi:MAG: ParB/RepB/Spo0J family partition protein, partial [Candidatus Dormibacteraceae bacterium]